MCNYCNKPKTFEEEANDRLLDKDFKNEVGVILEIDGNKLSLMTENYTYYQINKVDADEYITRKINYCPICGRKL